MSFPRAVMRLTQSEDDGSVKVALGGPGCGQLAMAAGFVAAGVVLAVIAVSRFRPAGAAVHALEGFAPPSAKDNEGTRHDE